MSTCGSLWQRRCMLSAAGLPSVAGPCAASARLLPAVSAACAQRPLPGRLGSDRSPGDDEYQKFRLDWGCIALVTLRSCHKYYYLCATVNRRRIELLECAGPYLDVSPSLRGRVSLLVTKIGPHSLWLSNITSLLAGSSRFTGLRS